MVAPSAPAAAEVYPISRRRVTLPLYQNSSVQSCVFVLSVIVRSSQVVLSRQRQMPCQLLVLAGTARRADRASLGEGISWCRILQDMRAHNAAPMSRAHPRLPRVSRRPSVARVLPDDKIGR